MEEYDMLYLTKEELLQIEIIDTLESDYTSMLEAFRVLDLLDIYRSKSPTLQALESHVCSNYKAPTSLNSKDLIVMTYKGDRFLTFQLCLGGSVTKEAIIDSTVYRSVLNDLLQEHLDQIQECNSELEDTVLYGPFDNTIIQLDEEKLSVTVVTDTYGEIVK